MHAPAPPTWRQLSDHDDHGVVVVMRSPLGETSDRYWCGPADPDSSTTWLRHRDPLTGRATTPERMAIFPDAWDATLAWTAYIAERRRRGVPVKEFAHFLPVERIEDWSKPPQRPHCQGFAAPDSSDSTGSGSLPWKAPRWLLADARVGAGR